MSGFDEVLFPLKLALGATGGPQRRTDIVTLGSGRETRNTPWAQGRRRYEIGGGVAALDDLHALVVFFEARQGRLRGFRFRDFIDWKSCAPGATPAATDQHIGIGDGDETVFQLRRAYGATARTIAKPVAGSVSIAVDGAPLGDGAFSVDATTGVVTLASPPAADAAITAGFLFDTPVRFDAERLDIALDGFGAGRPLAVPLIEILS
ncbi:MAG: TIGR02217 family protein [Alphaproteobacteria bacterium]|nr:TIGR02217 family protein [Alphaproteobacteria bacterium]